MTIDSEPASVLAVMAHPSDAELWSGGTLLVHGRSAQIDIAVEVAELPRLEEAQAAADVLGARLHIVPAFTRGACVNLLRRLRPEVVVTHDPDDADDAHRRAAGALLAGLEDGARSDLPRRLYRCDTYGPIVANSVGVKARVVDVTGMYERKLAALTAYGSFPRSGFAALVERRSRFWGDQVGVERAEAFLPLPILGRFPPVASL